MEGPNELPSDSPNPLGLPLGSILGVEMPENEKVRGGKVRSGWGALSKEGVKQSEEKQ